MAGHPLQLFKAGGQIHFFMKNARDDHAILPKGLIGDIAMLNQINRKFGTLRQGATVGRKVGARFCLIYLANSS